MSSASLAALHSRAIYSYEALALLAQASALLKPRPVWFILRTHSLLLFQKEAIQAQEMRVWGLRSLNFLLERTLLF